MSSIAIIPARGGSKRIPKKNIKDFLGKPIIAYAIEKAVQSGLFDEVMVSTDDEEIAAVAKQYGANIPFIRSTDNADDFATLADVVDEVMLTYENLGKHFDFGCCILPTSPLLTIDRLQEGFDLLQETKADSVRPVVAFSYPIQRAFRMEENGAVQMFNPEHLRTRSQDLETAYHDVGQFYWFTANAKMRGTNKYGFEIPSIFVQDIDTLEDWKHAELKYKMLNEMKDEA